MPTTERREQVQPEVVVHRAAHDEQRRGALGVVARALGTQVAR